MTKEDKENLKSKRFTESLLFSCLKKCETEIDANLYRNKKWNNHYPGMYMYEVEQWKEYRAAIRSLLLGRYPLNKIIQKSKGWEHTASKNEVEAVVGLIKENDFVLV